MSQHGCPERLSNRSKGFQEDGGSQATMEVLVETLTGTAFEMTVSPSDTILTIKSKIFRVEGIPISQQHILYNLKELEDSSMLREHCIATGARLRLVLGLRGGPVSTRRLPPPPGAEPWRDIERLLDTNREDGEWGTSGCKVTVLVFRDGERVNMLRVKENSDGTYSPLEQTKYTSSLPQLAETEPVGVGAVGGTGAGGGLRENAVTMSKMVELRRRMDSLSLRRAPATPAPPAPAPSAVSPAPAASTGDKVEIQKTRSEESLSVPSLLEEGVEPFQLGSYTPYCTAEDTFTHLYDGNYTRYDYDCSFSDRYTLLPPIGTRTDSEQSVQDAVSESERVKLSEALAGSILVQHHQHQHQHQLQHQHQAGREPERAILEECVEGQEDQLAANNLAPIPAAEYGPLVGGSGSGSGGRWRADAHGHGHSHSHSASSLVARAAPRPAPPAPLSDALFSSSTSDLENLKRNSSRILPALSRHRNREHLHLSDEGLDVAHRPRPRPHPRACPCPHPHPHPTHPRPRNLEVGSERRQRRIEKIAEMDARLLRFDDPFDRPEKAEKTETAEKEEKAEEDKGRKIRLRCGLCRKKLSIATVHRCRCGAHFCAPHRYAEAHGCAFDYKAPPAAPPAAPASRLPKI